MDLAEVIMACLSKEPGDRPDSAEEVGKLLAEKDEAATVSLVLADESEEAPVEDVAPLETVAAQ
jgi:hypothetical protein